MKLKHFEIVTPTTEPPQPTGWERAWYGYHEMTRVESSERRIEAADLAKITHEQGMITEEEFERDCLISILQELDTPNVNLFELGAGWGRISLAIAGIIDHKLAPIKVTGYRCLAIEAEPSHYQWTKDHFEAQNINGTVLHGAVSSKSGYCRFNAYQEPEKYYGQAINNFFLGNRKPNIGAFKNFFFKKTIKVPAYTVDQLVREHGFDRVDIVDVDVQGAECDVVRGSFESIKNKVIRYWLIGTHRPELNDQIAEILTDDYDLIVNVYPRSKNHIEGIPEFQCHDGIQLYKIRE